MRALLSHPLRLLTVCLVALPLLSARPAVAQLPQPIGPLSDYGAVLDRSGRDRLHERIAEMRSQHGLHVYVLASWEDPFGDIDRFASEILTAWGLDRGATALVVFVRYGASWKSAVRLGADARRRLGPVEARLHGEIEDLTEHRRIEEAMVAFFSALDRAAGGALPPAARTAQVPRWVAPAALGAVLLALGILVQRRVCPRCARVLRIRSSPLGGHVRVYYCRRCGYSRRLR